MSRTSGMCKPIGVKNTTTKKTKPFSYVLK
jgi:hypothetical protein